MPKEIKPGQRPDQSTDMQILDDLVGAVKKDFPDLFIPGTKIVGQEINPGEIIEVPTDAVTSVSPTEQPIKQSADIQVDVIDE